MKKKKLRILSVLLSLCMLLMSGITAFADRVDNVPYLALGADLSDSEKSTVLSLLGIAEDDLANYTVVQITNEDEHNYLGSYMDASVIGTRALSSVLVVGKEAGEGITVSTENISYCTTGMYRNALITAGIEDAEIKVAGPFSISGTAALVGAVKAYEYMSGEEISEESLDTAINELVVTGELADSTGDSESMEELIALVKQLIVENDIKNKEDMEEVINQAADELKISLSDEDRELIISLMEKISSLDLNIDSLKSQAKELYDKLDSLDINIDTEAASNFLVKIWNAVVDFFKGLFN